MRAGNRWSGGRAAALAAAGGLALSLACATIEPPPGGPEDKTPPRVTATWPESGAVKLRGVRELRLDFSEKVDPRDAQQLIWTFPPLAVRDTNWRGRQDVRISLADTLPRDTIVVVQIPAGFVDAHKVKTRRDIIYPLATADSLPRGEIDGVLLIGGGQGPARPLAQGVVELYPLSVDKKRLSQQTPLRRADTDTAGRFRMPWLAVPAGPWLLRAYGDLNGDRRVEEGEPQRFFADTVRVTPQAPRVTLAPLTLYPPSTPGSVATTVGATPPWNGPLYGWTQSIAEGDSGWTPAPLTTRPPTQRAVKRGVPTVWQPAGPGKVRVILFADLRGDSLFGKAAAADTDTLSRWLDPWVKVDSLDVEPGLQTDFRVPPFPANLTPWRPPAGAGAAAKPAAAPAETTSAKGTGGGAPRPAGADTARR